MSRHVFTVPLRDQLGEALPPDAREMSWGDGTVAFAWRPEGHSTPVTVVALHASGTMPRIALVAMEPHEVDAGTVAALAGNVTRVQAIGRAILTSTSFFHHGHESPGGLAPHAARLSGPQAGAASAFLSGWHALDDTYWEWLSCPVQGPSAIAFCREHPWLADECSYADEMRDMLVGGDMDAVARSVARLAAQDSLGLDVTDDAISPEDAASVVEILRRFRPPPGQSRRGGRCVRAMAAIPRECWPAPIPADRPDDAAAQADTAGFYLMAELAAPGPGLTPRQARALVGMRGRGWAGHVAALHARCGLPPVASADPVGAVTEMALAVKGGIEDTCVAFASEVLAPALMASGLDAGRAGEVTRGTAMRVLFGRRSLPRMCEVSRDWHARAASISGFIQSLRGEDGTSGPALFGDLDLGGDLFATCLRTPGELAAEGAGWPDATGAPGLAHCVGGYADRILAGRTAIVSIRRRLPGGGHERLSTVEVDYLRDGGPLVRQHRGHRNAPPPPEAVEVLPGLLEATADGARRALVAHRPAPRRRPTHQVIHEAGAWEAVRDLWSFALTRPQRAMGSAGLLGAAGVVAG